MILITLMELKTHLDRIRSRPLCSGKLLQGSLLRFAMLPCRLKSCTWIHVESLGYEIRRRGVLLVDIVSSNNLGPPHGGQIFPRRFIVSRRPSRNLGVPRRHIAYSVRSLSSDGRVCREGAASIRKQWENRGNSAHVFGTEFGLGRTLSISYFEM
ncbi:hypothetical protein BDP81DRAFT_439568, partial [Colletotrichum phormii]